MSKSKSAYSTPTKVSKLETHIIVVWVDNEASALSKIAALPHAKDEDGNNIPCWSLFFMGKKAQSWGFVKNGKWIDNKDYLKNV